jgi:propionate CoA-transferase
MYITERAVFRLIDSGLELVEIAPGIDLEKDILAHMAFKPEVSDNLKIMSSDIFK